MKAKLRLVEGQMMKSKKIESMTAWEWRWAMAKWGEILFYGQSRSVVLRPLDDTSQASATLNKKIGWVT